MSANGRISHIMPTTNTDLENVLDEIQTPEIDSKYRLIILAAKRSKQLQRGAHPRIEIDPVKHKPTRIALEEVMRGKVNFTVNEEDNE
jgi:DNA-directed RNA polymerase omega subunit